VQPAREWSHNRRDGVRVTVADNGCGIPRENLSRIFEAFFTTKDDATGTGLGLWVTRGILQKHNGSIRVRSSVSPDARGTVIQVFLPTTPQAVETIAA
jgi:signal transduction histidine kinase